MGSSRGVTGNRGTKVFILREGLIHAVIISPCKELQLQKELQLTFYANETTSPLHGRFSREGEHIIEFHPQYFDNPETVTSTVESEHDKTNTLICQFSEFYYQFRHPQSLISLRPSEESTIKRTEKNADTCWIGCPTGDRRSRVRSSCPAPLHS